MRFIVQLRPSQETLSLRGDGYSRVTSDQREAMSEASARHVSACLSRVRERLPDDVSITPAMNLHALFVSCPSRYAAEQVQHVKRSIHQACEDVVRIVDDFEMESIPSAEARHDSHAAHRIRAQGGRD